MGVGSSAPPPNKNFQRVLHSRVSMGTRAAPHAPRWGWGPLHTEIAGSWCGASAGAATAPWPPALTALKSSYGKPAAAAAFFFFFFYILI